MTSPWVMERVVWSGSRSCRVLAELLSPRPSIHVRRDSRQAIVAARATLHVTDRVPPGGLCATVSPHDMRPDFVSGVVGAVGGGPHSRLVATVVRRAAERLGVSGRLITGYRSMDRRPQALRVLRDMASAGVRLPMEALLCERPPELLASLPEGSLVVIGAPGGSWFQRQLFGPGVRLLAAAPAGTLVVRDAPQRVFQVMRPARALGPQMRVRDAMEVSSGALVLVAEYGRLIGMVARDHMVGIPGHTSIGDIAEPAVSLSAEELVDDVLLVIDEHDGGPLGVVDHDGALIGTVSSHELSLADVDGGRAEAS